VKLYSQSNFKKVKMKKLLISLSILSVIVMAGCKKEASTGVSPTVTSTNPVNKATSITLNSKVSANFSVVMDSSTITNASFTLQHGTTMVAGTQGYTGKTATFTPSVNLTPGTIYSAKISIAAKDYSGQTLEKDYLWSFTTSGTRDSTSPSVTLIDPSNNLIGVSPTKSIVATFSESMDPSSITSQTFVLKQGSTSISGTVTHTSTTATFTPTSALGYNKVYTGTITTGVKDLAENSLSTNYAFSFTTMLTPDIIAPTVNSTDPLNNATGVLNSKVVAITFSEAMDISTISASTFTLMQGTTPVTGTVSYSGVIATFTPSNSLVAGMTYTATITTGAKDLAGNALAANTVWSFTTVAKISGLAVVNLGAAGNYVILAKTAINNNPTSAITGDLGLSPAATSYATGFALTNATGYATSSQVTGNIYAADMADPTPINLTTAVSDMITAYNDAAGRPTPDFSELGTGSIGGKTLTAGLYKWTSTVTASSDVTISGSATDVWIFQISGDLNLSSAVNITLIGGAQAKNIFWQVAGQATFGTTSHFEGVILSMTGITLQTGASLNGRALAQSAVTLDGNVVNKP
jgi:hypothetical protein